MRGGAAVALALLLAAAGPAGAQEPARVVRQLAFEGNSALSDELLASAIATTNSSWFARAFLFRWLGLGEKRYFDEQEFKRDVVRLEVLYRRSGYPHAETDTVVRRTPTDVYITFRIKEGEPIRVTRLQVLGLDTLPAAVRRADAGRSPAAAGRPVQPLHHAGHGGYDRPAAPRPRVSVRAGIHQLREQPGDGDRRGHLRSRGRASSEVIGEVSVVGTNRIDPQVVRNLLITRPGRLYSQDEMFQSQRNLYSSDLFRYATVNVDTTKYRPDADSVPLLVVVSEARRRRIRGGLGYATDDCFRGSLGWTTRNFLGSGGRILDLTSRISKVGVGTPFDWGLDQDICRSSREDTVGSSKVNFNLGASIRRPAFLSPNNTIAVSLFTERRSEFKVYLRQETGTTVTLRRETPKRRIPLSLAYTLSYGHTEATAESFCASFNACTPDVVALLRQNRGARHAHGQRQCAAGQQSARSVARLAVVARAHVELALPWLELVPAVLPGRRRLLVVPPDRPRRGVQLAGPGRRHLRADRRRRHPERQLHSARAAVLRRRPQRRARLRPQRAGRRWSTSSPG